MRLPGFSLRATVFAAIVVAVLGPLAIWWSAQQALLREAYEPIVAQNRRAVLGLTAAALVEPLWTIDERGTQAALQSALSDPAVLRVRLTEQRPSDRSEPIVRDFGRPDPQALRLQSTLTREGEALGELEIWFDAHQLDRLIEARRVESYKLAALQVLLGMAVLTVVFYRRLLRPIERLKAQASRIAQSPRGEVETTSWYRRDELGELGEHLHDVHRQIRTLFEQIERQQAALEKLALHDSLTGLPNRLLFRELAHSACAATLRDGGSVALLFIDLDRFKAVNDSLGHAAGDVLLKTVARRLEGVVRAADVVCRHSGDEFLVLLHEPGTLDQLVATVERIQHELGRPLLLDGRELQVAASIGIALLPEDARSPDELIRHADLAMYEAKKAGRSQHSFYRDELNQRAQVQARLERELREALARNEFELHFQPQVDAMDGRLVGCEALIRWQHPQRGLVGPVEFIPVAEQAGLIGAIGEWVVRAACIQVARWKAAGFAFGRIAVNLSAAEFRDQRLVDTVRGAMQAHGVVAADLEIEITETVLMTDAGAPAIVAALQELGLPLVVDDFGTGYSSLAYLKRLRPRTIKIDRSFLNGLPDDDEDRVVVQAILGIARALGIEVVAEGVETTAQRDFLRDAGCPVLQGYWVSRPVPAAAFEAWAQARSTH